MAPKRDPRRFDDLFEDFGPIQVKRFFGGEGIYAGDVMIAMAFDDVIYFATDTKTRERFLAEKSKPFTFRKPSTDETVVTHWYAVPERLYDEPVEFADWAREALRASASSATARRKKRSRR